ncbi:MAG: hypothetical protein U1D30_16285, partial [Planctomycetota bacterium]
MFQVIEQAFDAIGAQTEIRTGIRRGIRNEGGAFRIDVRRRAAKEFFQLTILRSESIHVSAIDVRPKERHLVLDVGAVPGFSDGRFLCGHDERHWFVASLPIVTRTETVRGAFE